jgi:Fe-S-cluster containining protein
LECIRCGTCCSKYQAYMTIQEAKRIAKEMGEPFESWRAKYTDPRWPGTESLLLIHQNGACVFLKREEGGKTTLCLIHKVKPAACSEWASGWDKRECREGVLHYWGITATPNGELKGPEDKLKEFNEFTKSSR